MATSNVDDLPDWALSVTQSLLVALKERDPYTYSHCIRVAKLAKMLAQAAGLSLTEQRLVEFSSLFHDLGKIGVSDTVLLKPGRLTDEEDELMKLHPVKSAEILTPLTILKFFESIIPGILHHHERIDGMGYPFGLKNSQIPLHSRIILIVDTYDAMTSTRPYRKQLPPEVAYRELMLFSNRQFDEQLVKIFLQAHPSWAVEKTQFISAEIFKKVA